MIGNKHLDVLSFLLVCDVVWMGLLAQHCPVLLTSVRLLLLLALPVLLEATNITSVIVRVLEIVIYGDAAPT
jgi:hypothetical protein